MSTDKSLKHSKSKDKFLIALVSNFFWKHSGRVRDSSSYIEQTVQATGVSKRTVFRVRKELQETMCRSFTPTAISFRPQIISNQS